VIAVAVPLGVALVLLLLCMGAGLVLLRKRGRSRITLSRQGSSRQASGGLRQQQTCSSKGLDGGASSTYDGGEDGLSTAGGGQHRSLVQRYHPKRWLSCLTRAANRVLGTHPRGGTHVGGSELSVSDLASLPSQLGAYALRGLRSLTHPSNKPPGVGPDTALLLTDVQVGGWGRVIGLLQHWQAGCRVGRVTFYACGQAVLDHMHHWQPTPE
jgi:hypothetical protein